MTKTFGARRAVDGVSLSVSAGERVALVGPNGAGKSTTLYMILGLADPDSGSIALDGIDVHAHRSQAMSRLGFAAAYMGLAGSLRVRNIIGFHARLRGHDGAAIARAVERFGIEALLDKRAARLSSGQRTLTNVAIATLGEPKLLVLDEPTAYMDPDVSMRVRNGLLAINAQYGSAVLITSHNMTEVERLCDRVCFIASGRIIAAGSPTQLIEQSGHSSLEELWLDLAGVEELYEGGVQ
ncbi:MAG: ABC transporter ATP-binding protein [Acidimicrobiia bacterium]